MRGLGIGAMTGLSLALTALAPTLVLTLLLLLGAELGAAALTLAALAGAGVALVSWLLLRQQLLKPLRRLRERVGAMSAGDLDARIGLAGSDEVADLAAGIDRLAATLGQDGTRRKRFIADISHELRTPLAVLSGEVDALVDGVRPWNQKSQRSLQAEIGSLNRLVDDLYQLALADLGALAFHTRRVAIEDIVERVAERRERELTARGLRLVVEPAPRPNLMEGDAKRLTQLFDNLLQNSRRYTDPGGIVRIRTRTDDDRCLIEIEDSVPGVPDEALDKLFERLYRVEQSRSRTHGGSGLGLAIAQSIVEGHGGKIHADHSPLGGLRVSIRLPCTTATTNDFTKRRCPR